MQEVRQQEDGEDKVEVDDCITEHITHIPRASTTEGFGNTKDASSTEGFGDPTSTQEYIESSFEEKNYADKQSENTSQPVEKPAEKTQLLSDLKQKEVCNVFRNKDLRKMVLEKTQEQK